MGGGVQAFAKGDEMPYLFCKVEQTRNVFVQILAKRYPMARPRKVDALSLSELQNLIAERRSKVSTLRRERAKLLKKLAIVEREMERAGGEIGGRRSGGVRPRNDKPLGDAIEDVLKGGKAMRVPEIATAVQSNGYKSSSPKFTAIVNQTLIKDKRFHAVERGVYAMKK